MNMPKVVATDDLDVDRYELDLVRRIRRNDRASAEELVDRTYGSVYAALLKLTADPDLAADLTQETYRKAWQSFSSFRGQSKVYTWLYRIAYTTFLNVRRRPSVVRFVSADQLPEPSDSAPRPDERLITDLHQERLRNAILGLSDKQRFVVTAHYWGELSLPEIARLEGVSAVAIRKRLASAHEILLNTLEGNDD